MGIERLQAGAGPGGRPSLVILGKEQLARLGRFLGDFIYGLSGYEFEREARRLRGDLENLFMFMVMGDLLGVPVLPPYYSLRLVPYLTASVPAWKRRVLRERQPLESEEYDLHGI